MYKVLQTHAFLDAGSTDTFCPESRTMGHNTIVNADVDLLIDTKASKLIEPWKVINSRGEGPYAVRALLGWVVNGPLHGNSTTQCENGYHAVTVNQISVDTFS